MQIGAHDMRPLTPLEPTNTYSRAYFLPSWPVPIEAGPRLHFPPAAGLRRRYSNPCSFPTVLSIQT